MAGMRYGWMFAVAGCYAPHAGSPCDPTRTCPADQRCVAGFCAPGSPGDAQPADAPAGDAWIPDGVSLDATSSDIDGDGVPNAVDNCPTVYNPDQGNEDGDKLGDVCDPCPPVADNQPPDTDGDGVADACDPNPTTPGDKIVIFEGFHHGVPSGWTAANGMWMAGTADDVIVDDTANRTGPTLSRPGPMTGHETVSAGLTITNGAGGLRGAGVVDAFDPTGSTGIVCEAIQNMTGVLVLFDLGPGTPLASSPFQPQAQFRLDLRRDAASFTCHGLAMQDVSNNGSSAANGAELGIRARSVAASFAWVMVVSHP